VEKLTRSVGHGFRAGVRIGFEQLAQTRLVKITHWRFAIWLDPFGMLPSQVVVNLLLKLGQSVDRVADYNPIGYKTRCSKHTDWTIDLADSFNAIASPNT
jgi:hypothetical protein